MATSVVKRAGHSEPYLEAKLHESLRSALSSVRALEGEAALLASRVTAAITAWLEDKPEVTSRDIRSRAVTLLEPLHADAAYAYDIHDDVL